MKKIVTFYCIGLLFLCFLSCDKDVFYNKSFKVDKKGWDVNDRLYFDVSVTDTNRLYDFYIDIRNTVDFPYQNVFFFINTTFPNGNIAHDTLECILASSINGEWLGKGKGEIRDNRFLFKPRVIFPMSGIYKFEIEQAMRDEKIIGLSDVGLRILYSTK